jgi:solute carrier family 25 oxoglutarate transporter 11
MADKKPAAKNPPSWTKFVNGGLSGMIATCFVQPLDLVKTRMQLLGESGAAKKYPTSFHALFDIARTEGIMACYNGLSAGLLRQATYTTTRLGVYQYLTDATAPKDGSQTSFLTKLGIGMTSGGVGALIGTPAEVALIRQMADGRLPVEQRRGYKNAFDALVRITKEEGVTTLWRGWRPTVMRAMVLNAAQLGVYSQAKEMLVKTGYFSEGMPLHFAASLVSGFVSTAVSIPIDISKTRLQNMKVIDGKPQYSGTLDCLQKVIRSEGVLALWRGFTPYFLRLGPHTIITFIALEKLNVFTKKAFA